MNPLIKPGVLAVAVALLSACNSEGGDGAPVTVMPAKYRITVTNMTAGQPFSPPVLVLHGEGYHAFEEGKGAGVGLEMIAESGNNAEFAADARARGLTVTADGATPILPGQSRSYTVQAASMQETRLSMAAMLGKTNDGFTGVDNLLLDLQPGEQRTLDLPAWDAGTEADTETAATLGALGGGGVQSHAR